RRFDHSGTRLERRTLIIYRRGVISMRSDAVFAGLVTALFFAAAATVAAHHEMWRDECQAWLIARDANSLTDLRDHMHYEGHPAGWHAVLFVLTRWSDDPRVMQACTLLFATVSTWIVARHAPFSRLTRALWVFGYFPFYEYTVLARSYTLSVLLVLAATLFATK